MGWGGIATVLGKLSTFIPGRIEKIKNERERLVNEKKILQSKEWSATAARRVPVIDKRVREIDAILRNNAKD